MAKLKVHYFGDYELLGELGRGGMGVVYRARQVSLNRTVAVKMILTGHLATKEEVRRFRTEAESAANLEHPNIVSVYEVGEHDGQHYFSMQWVEGLSLTASPVPLLSRDAVKVVAAVSRAVHYAHQRGILHRDIKPGNIVIDAKGEPHITDFGLAKRMEAGSGLTHTGTIMGTPGFMAPEQAAGLTKQLTTAVDIYSLGAVLYFLLTGRPPFVAETALQTMQWVIEKEPIPPRMINRQVERDLETVCLKCLEKDPARRYESANALADDLEHWLRDEPIRARRPGQTEKLWRWFRRQPVAASLVTPFIALGITYFLVAATGSYPFEWRVWGARTGGGASLLILLLGLFNGLVALTSNKRLARSGIYWSAVAGVVLNLLPLGLLALIIVRGGPKMEPSRQRALQQVGDAARDDLRKTRESFDPARGFTNVSVAKLDLALRSSTNVFSGETARLMQACRSLLNQAQAVGGTVSNAIQEIRKSDIMNYATITNQQILQDRREVVHRFLVANEARLWFTTNRQNCFTEIEDALSQVAKIRGVPAEVREKHRAQIHEHTDRVKGVLLEMNNADRIAGQSLLGILSLLETNWGRWRVDASTRRAHFEDDKARSIYSALLTQIEAAADLNKVARRQYLICIDTFSRTSRAKEKADDGEHRIPDRDPQAKP